MKRVEWGFVVSALGFPMFIFALSGFHPGTLFVAAVVAVVTTLATFVVGLPVYRVCRERGWLTLWPFFLGGISAGALFALPFGLLFERWDDTLGFVEIFSIIGGVHGAVFWVVAIWGNAALRGGGPPASDYATRKLP